ncbi:hypothetical protein CH35J_002996 [Colletotrichum higginsianum]|uniref:Extracellular membrane protein CFEM domain-containing protein n=1 Tax=Colletotrichum higginsianum TaxID=80884 RepID=A0A4T0WEV8_9PEZI|nr:hypothetical protein CH35J_002996 [Colletotrichum higginsianum]
MAPSRRKALALLSILLSATPTLAKFENNFDLYPAAAQPCLYAASDASQCDGDSNATMNQCLCSDSKGKFVTNTATCLGREAKDTLRTVYQSMSTACSDSKTPIPFTEDQFLALGASGATASSLAVTPSRTSMSSSSSAAPTGFITTTTTGGATVTVTTSPTATPTAEPEDSGLSTEAKIGVGVGAGVGAIALVGLVVFIWRIKRSRDAHDESHRPMLGSGVGGGRNPHHGPFTEYSPPTSVSVVGDGGGGGAFGAAYAGGATEYKNENKQQGWRPASEVSQSPDTGTQTWATGSPLPAYAQSQPQSQPQQQQQHGWGHHPQASYVPPPHQQQQQQQQAARHDGVFELASMPVSVAEMPATEVQLTQARYQYPPQRQ